MIPYVTLICAGLALITASCAAGLWVGVRRCDRQHELEKAALCAQHAAEREALRRWGRGEHSQEDVDLLRPLWDALAQDGGVR